MNLTRQLIELNKNNIVPKKFDTKIKCITYILSFYQLKNVLTGSLFDLFYDLKLRQLQHICHKIKEYINNDESEEAFVYIINIKEFLEL